MQGSQGSSERLVVFDGVCNFCASSVRFVVRHDPRARFKFAAAQSARGRALLAESGVDPDRLETFVLRKHGRTYVRSDAALEIARELAWPWRMLAVLRIVPRGLRDRVYDWAARNRYRWFGRKDACMVPTEDIRARFLE